ncbi:hypothetical protein GCM10025779_19410 [Arthrobacter cryoconiti]
MWDGGRLGAGHPDEDRQCHWHRPGEEHPGEEHLDEDRLDVDRRSRLQRCAAYPDGACPAKKRRDYYPGEGCPFLNQRLPLNPRLGAGPGCRPGSRHAQGGRSAASPETKQRDCFPGGVHRPMVQPWVLVLVQP